MQQKIISIAMSVGIVLAAVPASAQLFDKMAGVESTQENSAVPSGNLSQPLDIKPLDIKPLDKPTTSDVRQSMYLGAGGSNIATLTAYIDGSQTLSGAFEQIVFSDRGESISSGTFRLKRPGLFDWQYSAPNEQRIISNGSKVYHYDKDLEQITIRPRNELAGDVAMNLLVGDKKLQQSFDVSIQPSSKAPPRLRNNEPGLTFYQLTPKGHNDDVDQVWLVMRNGNLAAVYIDTGVGQESLIVLHGVSRNDIIPVKAFNFTPPPGVDVIGG